MVSMPAIKMGASHKVTDMIPMVLVMYPPISFVCFVKPVIPVKRFLWHIVFINVFSSLVIGCNVIHCLSFVVVVVGVVDYLLDKMIKV